MFANLRKKILLKKIEKEKKKLRQEIYKLIQSQRFKSPEELRDYLKIDDLTLIGAVVKLMEEGKLKRFDTLELLPKEEKEIIHSQEECDYIR